MCGIVGVWQNKNRSPLPSPILERMRDVMVHRGPDDKGGMSFLEGRLWLGHRRLSILDLSTAGKQPLSYADGRYWIIFNGEIYNYQSIRRELAGKGYEFCSRTDTEVILAAFDYWGHSCLEKFNGMWAFAIFDQYEKSLFLARDRFGIKPLYYYHQSGAFIFASEIRAILASELVGCSINPDAVAEYLLTGLVDGLPQTFFQDVMRFPAGHYAYFKDGQLDLEQYWSLPYSASVKTSQSIREQVQEFRELFFDAVRLRLISDVPVGTCLSGGLDSSSIFSVASLQRSEPLKTFSSFFTETEEFDERRFFSIVAEKYKAEPYIVQPDGNQLMSLLPRIIWHLEEPSKAMGVFPQWHVMALAGNEVTVLLDGQGGDEILAGYDPYLDIRFQELARRFAWYMTWQEYRHSTDKIKFRTISKHWLRHHAPGLAEMMLSQRSSTPSVYESYLGLAISDHETFQCGASGHQIDLLNDRLAKDVECNMLPALLKYEDKLGMAFSLEARVPLLDYRLVEQAFTLPSDMKYTKGWGKYILRLAMEGVLPEEIQWRRDKKGFPTPTRLWFAGEFYQDMQNLLLEGKAVKDGWLSREGVEQVLLQHRAGIRDFSWELWRLVSFEIWLSLINDLTNRSYAQPLIRR
jgi:asparagine synthase (glutamine-hydrolysing)